MKPDFALPQLAPHPHAITLFVAMESEAAPVARALGMGGAGDGASRTATFGGTRVRLVTPGRDEIARVDRIGPLHAAIALERALAAEPADLVVNIGTAGGFESQGLAIADLVLAGETMFHDARVGLPGFDAVARAHARLSLDQSRLETLAATLGARVGLVSTGSSLDATPAELAHFAAVRALAKEMELAALAVVCRDRSTPLVALKGITDLVDHHEPVESAFLRNLERTCARLAEAAPALLGFLTAR